MSRNREAPLLTIAIITRQFVTWFGLRTILESRQTIRVVGEPCQQTTTPPLLTACQPDIVILDTELEPDLARTIKEIRETVPKTKVLLLSGFEDMDRVREALACGIDDVLLKIHPPPVLLAVIEALYSTPSIYCQPNDRATAHLHSHGSLQARMAPPEIRAPLWPDALTERERDVIRLVGQGLSNKDIAYQLSISDSTVRHHLTNIFDKLGVSNRQKLLVHTHSYRSAPA